MLASRHSWAWSTKLELLMWMVGFQALSLQLGAQAQTCVDNISGFVDSGGDTCAFYDQQPQYCGCCDTEYFVADIACCSCKAFRETGADPSTMSVAFSAWPVKATNLSMQQVDLSTADLGAVLSRLPNLETLSLADCGLQGNLPSEIGTLSQLKSLHLNSNRLSGPLPPELGGLTKLLTLVLKANALSGGLPSELGNLVNLKTLDLEGNQFSGSLPSEIWNLSSLMIFSVTKNRFSGSLSAEVGSLTNLMMLQLGFNQFSGPLPSEIGNLIGLKHLIIEQNAFSGPLPPELGKLSGLMFFKAGVNQFTSIPPEMGEMSSLFWLDLGSNQLTGSLPPEITKLTRLGMFRIPYNSLSGSLPSELGRMASLFALSLPGNQFAGSIPSSIGDLSQLKLVVAEDNDFSGPLPPDFGKLKMLYLFRLARNRLSGEIPPELGGMAGLDEIQLQGNQLTGSVPASFGQLPILKYLYLQSNQLSGELPREMGNISSLTSLDVSGNKGLTGSLAFIEDLTALESVQAVDCAFNMAAGLPPKLETLNLARNSFSSVPAEWRTRSVESLKVLNLEENAISTWELTGVMPDETDADGRTACNTDFQAPHLQWPQMTTLRVSGNPLNMRVRDFIGSIAYLPMLVTVEARSCGLYGLHENPGAFGYNSIFGAVHLEHPCAAGRASGEQAREGFLSLARLDLSRNNITGIIVPASQALWDVDFSFNALIQLHSAWYNEGGDLSQVAMLNIKGNPLLRRDIITLEEGICPIAGAPRLLADPMAYADVGEMYECTSLCRGVRTSIQSETSLQVESLCRCTHGEGAGSDCTPCPSDTYSSALFVDGSWARSCRLCPPNSRLSGGQALQHRDCQCDLGYYMTDVVLASAGSGTPGNASDAIDDPASGECRLCAQWPFRTTKAAGSQSSESCGCSGEYSGLLARGARCGCDDGYFMNHAQRECIPCSTGHEECVWGFEKITQSLEPPVLKPGYWAEPALPPDEFGRSNFSGNDIWRCVSKFTCIGGGECIAGRFGRACGLCKPGTYGPPEGGCSPCSHSPSGTRSLFGLGCVLATPLCLLAHAWLDRLTRQDLANGRLVPVTVSLGQLSKFLQVLGIISAFRVEWPEDVRAFFKRGADVSTGAGSSLGAACLAAEQTVALELGFRWSLLVAPALVIAVSVLTFYPAHPCLKKLFGNARISLLRGLAVKMGPWEGFRVFILCVNLGFPTFLNYALAIFTCVPSPNGLYSVAAFPHLKCSSGESEWMMLAAVGSVFLSFVLVAFPCGVYQAWRVSVKRVLESNFQSKGWWRFFFQPYRPIAMHWILTMIARDVALNLVACLAASRGSVQLLLTAVICLVYACKAVHSLPYYTLSSTVLDVWYCFAIASMCVYAAAAGFQTEPGLGDVSEMLPGGKSDPEYQVRVASMVTLQWASLIGPLVIMPYQILMAFDQTRNLVPNFLRPLDRDTHEQLSEDLCQVMGVKGHKFRAMLKSLDSVETFAFWRLMTAGKPTEVSRSIPTISKMSAVGRSDPKFLTRAAMATGSSGDADIEVAAAKDSDPRGRIQTMLDTLQSALDDIIATDDLDRFGNILKAACDAQREGHANVRTNVFV